MRTSAVGILGLLLCVLVRAALPAVDTFNRTDGGLGANWTTVSGLTGHNVSSNGVRGGGAGRQGSLWSADTFGNDQYAQLVIATNNANYAGVILRGSVDGAGYYLSVGAYGAAYYIEKCTAADVCSTLNTGNPSWTPGDLLRCEVSGSSSTLLQCFQNGALFASYTDSASPILSGFAGLAGYNPDAEADNWEAGNLGGGDQPGARRQVISGE